MHMKRILLSGLLTISIYLVSVNLNAQPPQGTPNPKANFKARSKEEHMKAITDKVLAKTKFSDEQKAKVVAVYTDFLDAVEQQQTNGKIPSKETMDKTIAKKDAMLKKALSGEQLKQFLTEERLVLMETAKEKGMNGMKVMPLAPKK